MGSLPSPYSLSLSRVDSTKRRGSVNLQRYSPRGNRLNPESLHYADYRCAYSICGTGNMAGVTRAAVMASKKLLCRSGDGYCRDICWYTERLRLDEID